MPTTTLNPPPPTPARGTRIVVADLVRELNDALPPKPAPLADRFHADNCLVHGGLPEPHTTSDAVLDAFAREFVNCVADAVALEVTDPPVEFEDPQLTPGQKRVFEGERGRLFRLLDDRRPRSTVAVLVLLDDMASQAPAVDQVIAEEAQRRRAAAAERPTVALALGRNRGQS